MKKETVVVVVGLTTVVGVGLLVRHWKRRTEIRRRRAQQIIRKFARNCAAPAAKLMNISNDLASYNNNNNSEIVGTNLRSHVPYLVPLPTGEEKGTYYGINFRGTNFLIVRAKLQGKNEPVSKLQKHEVAIPSSILTNGDSTTELFDFISLELAKFISLHNESSMRSDTLPTERKLGFTVSASLADREVPLASSKWNRLSCDETVGRELANEINLALEKHRVHMRVLSVVSDSVGNLAGGRYYSKECVAAVTLGMRTDISYIDSMPQESLQEAETVISMQWGNFNSSHLPITEYDALDAGQNTGIMMFEKLVSGMYLGEIVRRVLLKMAHEASLFGDHVPPKLATPCILRSPDMAAMHQDTSEGYDIVDEKLNEIFQINNTSPMAREMVAEVCDIVAERGARLVGAGIVGIVKRLNRMSTRKSIVIIEGGLYEHYRVFRNYIHSSIWEMLRSEISDNLIIEHAHGGSGAGSIFLAASQTSSSVEY